ncbi:hypothetical protein FXF51_35325 [Nonomuraea sp. PA05]|nr:hypothetical protein FXF51_35325 [Nonomuraea sp. PA05]
MPWYVPPDWGSIARRDRARGPARAELRLGGCRRRSRRAQGRPAARLRQAAAGQDRGRAGRQPERSSGGQGAGAVRGSGGSGRAGGQEAGGRGGCDGARHGPGFFGPGFLSRGFFGPGFLGHGGRPGRGGGARRGWVG